MNMYDRKLLNGFFKGKFSKNQVVEKFDLDGLTPDVFISKEIESASNKENADELEDAITLIFIFDEKNIPIAKLNSLLLEHWHYRHEDIASLLQDAKSESSVDYLYKSIKQKYNYLMFDDSCALAVKCIWGLGDINNEASILKLLKLCKSDINVIRDNASAQLDKLSRL